MTTAVAVRHCEARIRWRPGEWRQEPVMCSQVVGVATVIDATGTVRGACPIEGHREQVVRRFGTYPGELAADESAAVCCGAGGSTPHWVYCPERIPENVNRALYGDR